MATVTTADVDQLLATVGSRIDTARADLADGDAYEALGAIETALTTLTDARLRAVRLWHQRGASWTDVAAFYEITRQAAWERFSERDRAPEVEPQPRLTRQQRRALARRGGGS